MTLLGILFATGFTFLVCLLVGKMVPRLVGGAFTRLEESFLGFVTGAACLSTIVLGLTAAGLAYRGIFPAAGLVLIAIALKRGAHRFSGVGGEWPWRLLFGALFALFGVLYLGNALEPETSPDGIAYYVALAARYLREHHFPRITINFTANYPEGVEMLFLFAFAFGKHTAAAMVHFLFLLMMPLGMLAYGRRIGLPAAGVVGGLLFFMSPIVGKAGSSAYVDVALAAAVFAVFLLLEIWREQARASAKRPPGSHWNLRGICLCHQVYGRIGDPLRDRCGCFPSLAHAQAISGAGDFGGCLFFADRGTVGSQECAYRAQSGVAFC